MQEETFKRRARQIFMADIGQCGTHFIQELTRDQEHYVIHSIATKKEHIESIIKKYGGEVLNQGDLDDVKLYITRISKDDLPHEYTYCEVCFPIPLS